MNNGTVVVALCLIGVIGIAVWITKSVAPLLALFFLLHLKGKDK